MCNVVKTIINLINPLHFDGLYHLYTYGEIGDGSLLFFPHYNDFGLVIAKSFPGDHPACLNLDSEMVTPTRARRKKIFG